MAENPIRFFNSCNIPNTLRTPRARELNSNGMTTLFRPVGLNELSLIWDSGMREFPPRLPHQPIFYPVANRDYATQIAKDWNTKESSFAGYVTKFSVQDSHLADYEQA